MSKDPLTDENLRKISEKACTIDIAILNMDGDFPRKQPKPDTAPKPKTDEKKDLQVNENATDVLEDDDIEFLPGNPSELRTKFNQECAVEITIRIYVWTSNSDNSKRQQQQITSNRSLLFPKFR